MQNFRGCFHFLGKTMHYVAVVSLFNVFCENITRTDVGHVSTITTFHKKLKMTLSPFGFSFLHLNIFSLFAQKIEDPKTLQFRNNHLKNRALAFLKFKK